MKILQKINYHIKGTPKMSEAPVGSADSNYLQAMVYYTEGGYSYLTYKNTPRGYLMSVVDVQMSKKNGIVSVAHTLFNERGRKHMIKEVTRQSKKAEAEALEYFKANIVDFVNKAYPEHTIEEEET